MWFTNIRHFWGMEKGGTVFSMTASQVFNEAKHSFVYKGIKQS
jgi:hypothetical protein